MWTGFVKECICRLNISVDGMEKDTVGLVRTLHRTTSLYYERMLSFTERDVASLHIMTCDKKLIRLAEPSGHHPVGGLQLKTASISPQYTSSLLHCHFSWGSSHFTFQLTTRPQFHCANRGYNVKKYLSETALSAIPGPNDFINMGCGHYKTRGTNQESLELFNMAAATGPKNWFLQGALRAETCNEMFALNLLSICY